MCKVVAVALLKILGSKAVSLSGQFAPFLPHIAFETLRRRI
jgi:hypothetical protein